MAGSTRQGCKDLRSDEWLGQHRGAHLSGRNSRWRKVLRRTVLTMTDDERRALHGMIDDSEKAIAMLQSVKRRAILLLSPQPTTNPGKALPVRVAIPSVKLISHADRGCECELGAGQVHSPPPGRSSHTEGTKCLNSLIATARFFGPFAPTHWGSCS